MDWSKSFHRGEELLIYIPTLGFILTHSYLLKVLHLTSLLQIL